MAANVITIATTVSIKGTGISASLAASDSVNQVGSAYNEETQVITSAAPVKLNINPDIQDGNLMVLSLRNTAAVVAGVAAADANYIDIATDSTMTNKIATIPPSKSHPIPTPGGTVNLWAQAHLADIPCVFLAIET